MFYLESFHAKTTKEEILDITRNVGEIVSKSGAKNGLAVVYTPHTTASVIINENEKGLVEDIKETLAKIVPRSAGYKHDRIDNNAHSHIKAVIVGNSRVIPLVDKKLALGTWEHIFLADFDPPRTRTVNVLIFGEL